MKLAVLKGFEDKNNVTIPYVPYTVGRCRSADFVIAHVNVSRNHCKIVKENDCWKIDDFSSSGTYVNDALVGKGKSSLINDGDCIRFGPKENNLCWTFYSFNSSSKNSGKSDTKQTTQVVLNVYNEKLCLKEKNVPGSNIHLATEEQVNEENPVVAKNDGVKNSNESDVNVHQPKTDTNILKVIKDLQNVKGYLHTAKEEVLKGEGESVKIQELTKELQEVQNVLNDLEGKNCGPQVELTAGGSGKTETSSTTNLLENFADLMEAEFQCTICSELFVTAVTLTCTHTFCKYCINLWKKKQKTCPICRKKITSETRSLVVDNYIDKVVGNLSLELKERREAIIKERNQIEPCKKKAKNSKANT